MPLQRWHALEACAVAKALHVNPQCVMFCAVLGFVQEYRAGRALDALRDMLVPMITGLRS